MVKFSPTTLNFGYDFVLFVHFFGTPCALKTKYFSLSTSNYLISLPVRLWLDQLPLLQLVDELGTLDTRRRRGRNYRNSAIVREETGKPLQSQRNYKNYENSLKLDGETSETMETP